MTEDNAVNLEKILTRVRALIAKAESCNDPESTAFNPEEADAYDRMADALMLKYSIDKAAANQSAPAAAKIKPIIIKVEVGDGSSDIIGHVGQLCTDIATHCRCKVRMWAGYEWRDNKAMYYAKVYGFEGEARYFEMLYTTQRLHMMRMLMPRFDPAMSFEDNCYHLHNAGYNWMQMAAMQGWKKFPNQTGVPGHLIRYYNQKLGQEDTAGKIGGGIYKKAYHAACKARGEVPVKIAAGSTDHYRKSAATAYTTRLRQRLAMIRNSREQSSKAGELILASTMDDLDALFREDNPDLFKETPVNNNVKVKAPRVKMPKYKPAHEGAWEVGTRYANAADLGTGVGGRPAKELS